MDRWITQVKGAMTLVLSGLEQALRGVLYPLPGATMGRGMLEMGHWRVYSAERQGPQVPRNYVL